MVSAFVQPQLPHWAVAGVLAPHLLDKGVVVAVDGESRDLVEPETGRVGDCLVDMALFPHDYCFLTLMMEDEVGLLFSD